MMMMRQRSFFVLARIGVVLVLIREGLREDEEAAAFLDGAAVAGATVDVVAVAELAVVEAVVEFTTLEDTADREGGLGAR